MTATSHPEPRVAVWHRQQAAVSGQPVQPLTPRQRQILEGLAAGKTYEQIGRDLYVTAATVRTHVGHILDRLQARNTPHAVAIGYRNGLLPGEDVLTTDARGGVV